MVVRLGARCCHWSRMVLVALAVGILAAPGAATVRAVAVTQVLGWAAREVGGELASVSVIVPGTVDPHYFEATPGTVSKVQRADVVFRPGLRLCVWLDPVFQAAGRGYLRVDCSRGIAPLEVPRERVDPSMGHLHPEGNPHYWLDPRNAMIMVSNVLAGFIQVNGDNADAYKANARELLLKLRDKREEWREKLAPYGGAKVIDYHPSWIYFVEAFGLVLVMNVEGRPGIPPSGGRVSTVVKQCKLQGVRALLIQTFYPHGSSKSIGEAAGIPVLRLPDQPGGLGDGKPTDYLEMMDDNVARLTEALRG